MPIPRFVSIKVSEANIRTGPNTRYPIQWVVKRRWLPVEVIAEFEQWRKVRDVEGDEGWIHESLLTGRRSAIISGSELRILYRLPDDTSTPLARIEPSVQARLLECKIDWCRVKVAGYKGWLKKSEFWGAYSDEEWD